MGAPAGSPFPCPRRMHLIPPPEHVACPCGHLKSLNTSGSVLMKDMSIDFS
jgi:hypothetical protein